jgi:protein-tyrosine phosphatase
MRALVAKAGLEGQVSVDSAGTGSWHIGNPPDPRSREAGKRRGLDLRGRARQFKPSDWEEFDYVLALDASNYSDLQASVRNDDSSKLFLLRSFDTSAPSGAGVPDPYYGGERGFDVVIDQCVAACQGLLDHIRREHRL